MLCRPFGVGGSLSGMKRKGGGHKILETGIERKGRGKSLMLFVMS